MKQRVWLLSSDAKQWLFGPGAVFTGRFDRRQALAADPGSERVLVELIEWLARAQDNSLSIDGGVARDFSLQHGWSTSYPETTGYIVPTMLQYAQRTGRTDLTNRARRMLDWLVDIQLPCGGYQGGKVDSRPLAPVTFNTGQVLLGLAEGQRTFGGYEEPLRRAADWLIDNQDADGCWRRHLSPFASSGEKAYEAHAAWGLLEADRLNPGRGYAEAALANVRWAMTCQRDNGWLDCCCLVDASKPLTHTIGYALRGVIEAYRFSGEPSFLESARRAADGALSALRADGHLPALLLSDWSAGARYVCLTGSAQLACCWLLLSRITGEARYATAAFKVNEFVRRTVRVDGPSESRGAVSGSYPASGAYGRYQYLSWGAKFLADSLMLESDLRQSSRPTSSQAHAPLRTALPDA